MLSARQVSEHATIPDIERRAMARIAWRIGPILMALFLTSVIDRSNIGFAKLQMVGALHLTEASFAFASSLFFLSYTCVELPSALGVHRFGARLWFARIAITWGLLTIATAWATSAGSFTVARLLLGAAEGGLYPGLLFVLMMWFPQRYRAQAVGLITLGSAIGNMLSAVISGPLLDLHGLLGLAGWQWVFIVTGLPAALLGVGVIFWLPNGPEQARFLSPGEKSWLADELAKDAAPVDHRGVLSLLWDPRVLLFSLFYTLVNTSLFGIIYWLPTVVKAFGATGTQNGLLTALPWTIAAVLLLWLPRRMRNENAVLGAMMVIGVVGLVCFISSSLLPDAWMRYAALAVGAPCASLIYPCFWYFPSRYLEGRRAAAGLAVITTMGGFGGFAGQNAMPSVAQLTGHPITAMLVPATCLGILAAAAAARRTVLATSARSNIGVGVSLP